MEKENYPITFYENRFLAYFLTIIFAIALFLSLTGRNAFKGLNSLIMVFGVFVLLFVISIIYPSSYIVIRKNGFTYKKGRINWQASWDEVEALYLLMGSNSFMSAFQIKTKSGSTKLISPSAIMKKESNMPSLLPLLSLNHLEFIKKFKDYKNKDAQELISILEKLSNKRAENYRFTSREKIRK